MDELPPTEIKIVDSDVTIVKKFNQISTLIIENWFINEGKKIIDTFLETKSKQLTFSKKKKKITKKKDFEFNLEMVSYLNRALTINIDLTFLCLYGRTILNNESLKLFFN